MLLLFSFGFLHYSRSKLQTLLFLDNKFYYTPVIALATITKRGNVSGFSEVVFL